MGQKVVVRPEAGTSTMPPCQMWDAVQLGMSGAVNPAATQVSVPVDVAGYRRYRFKAVQLTGTGPTRVRVLDVPFGRSTALAFEIVILAAAMATGIRTVWNFGEGTAILQNFMGLWLVVDLQNNGPDGATYELELWAQA